MQIGVETSKAVDQRRVFVADEDEINRAAPPFMLHDKIETHELASLEDAYEKGVDWLAPHVVLLGVSFLRNRGVGFVKEVNAKFPGVRILIVCAKADEAIAVEGLKAGAHGAVVKPFTVGSVRKRVDTILGRSGGAPLIQLGGMRANVLLARFAEARERRRGHDEGFQTLQLEHGPVRAGSASPWAG